MKIRAVGADSFHVDVQTDVTKLIVAFRKLAKPSIKILYTITLCSSFAPTCSLRYVKFLTEYGGSSSNDTYSSLFINLFLSEVQHLNLSS
jgi:hypothetical protein